MAARPVKKKKLLGIKIKNCYGTKQFVTSSNLLVNLLIQIGSVDPETKVLDLENLEWPVLANNASVVE